MIIMNSRTLFVWITSVAAGAVALRAAEPDRAVQLRGIVCFATNQLALLELQQGPPSQGECILGEGQRDGALEVLKIDVASGTVKVKNAGDITELALKADASSHTQDALSSINPRIGSSHRPYLRLEQAGSDSVFKVYQLLTLRSVIRCRDLPGFELDLFPKEAATPSDLAKALEQALAEKGVVLTPDRDKFTVAGGADDHGKITPQLWTLAAQLGGTVGHVSAGVPQETMPAGMIDFRKADFNQVLLLYQELANRTVLRAARFPTSNISFRSYTPLTRTEVIYALQAMFAANDISIAPAGEKFLLLLPTAETNRVAALLSRKPAVPAASKDGSMPAGAIDCRMTPLGRVAEIYQGLTGRPVEMEPGLSSVRLTLRSQTELTSGEALQALDLLLGLHGLSVAPQDDGQGLKIVLLREH